MIIVPDSEKRTGKGCVDKLINNKMLTFFEIEAFNNDDVYRIFKDKAGGVWICVINIGVYLYVYSQ